MEPEIPAGLEDQMYEEWRDERRYFIDTDRSQKNSYWTLRGEDIDQVAARLGIDPNRLTVEHYEEIVRYILTNCEHLADNWDEVLKDAIKMTLK